MGASFSAGLDRTTVGVDPGWKVVFLKESGDEPDRSESDPPAFTRSDYDAEIRVSRASRFRAGSFEITIVGLTDEEFGKIVGEGRVFVEIHLGWRDLAEDEGGAFGAALASMFSEREGKLCPTIVGRITGVERSAGEYLYRTTFRGIDAGFHRVACTDAPEIRFDANSTGPELIQRLCEGVVEVRPHMAGDPPRIADPQSVHPDRKLAYAIREVVRRAHAEDEDRSLPLFFRLEGGCDAEPLEVLHVGHWDEPIGGPHELDGSTGLADARPVFQDRPRESIEEPYQPPAAEELTYDLTLLGRADIRVGDQVKLEVDQFTAGASLGSLVSQATGFDLPGAGGERPAFDVVSLEHHLSPDSGFVTRLRVAPHPETATRSDADEAVAERDEAERIAASLQSQRRAVELRMFDVGFVERQNATEADEDGRRRHAQRRDVREGLERSASPNQAVSAAMAGTTLPLRNRPYLTPFAWKQAGLVVPHYPGTRVVDLHYRGISMEGIVAGCLWDEGQEPDARNGDWWLCLPTGVPDVDATTSLPDVPDPEGPGAHDLIDADGRRAMHVAGFRITIGTDLMKPIGERPDDPPDAELEIRHQAGNACIKIDSSGNIEISTDGTLKFKANRIEAEVADRFEVTG